MLEIGGSAGDSLRAAGYSDAMVKNPQKVTKSKAFVKVLEAAGMTDAYLAKSHQELMQASKLETIAFHAIKREVWVTKDKNGKKLKSPEKDWVYRHIPDEVIQLQVEAVPAVKLLWIQKGFSEKIAYIKVPENAVRKSAIEMGYKVKDHFAADKLEIVEHELTDDEMGALHNLFEIDKK